MKRRMRLSTLDPDFLKEISSVGCLACGIKSKDVYAHHIKTKAAGGGDDPWNIIPLCNDHHTIGPKAWHKIGPSEFLKQFPHVWAHLQSLGWEMLNGKLWNSKNNNLHGKA